ncbi:hypothetical protein [Streptomyces sp. ADI95-16]|uniref:hypothetical protein n=1 Tax=Streptomyces sp. ADI95-16 TaxID=1522758 RepID=UPI000F3A9AB8|nr:hypothetical protein [Streptomyces sp. ADI95-16]
MDAFRKYFEDNPDIFTALVAALAICGSYLAGVRGAKIQAGGGRDQAAAAREAAQITADAQRVAALWTVRQVQLAELIRSADTLVEVCDRFWIDGGDDLAGQVSAASAAVSSRWNEVRLIVTESVVQAAGELARSAMTVEENAQRFAPVMSARNVLSRIVEDDPHVGHEIDEVLAMEVSQGHRARALANLIGDLTEEQAHHIVAYDGPSEVMLRRTAEVRREFTVALNALVHEARTMLRSEDDVVPAVPQQRRRWWQRAA